MAEVKDHGFSVMKSPGLKSAEIRPLAARWVIYSLVRIFFQQQKSVREQLAPVWCDGADRWPCVICRTPNLPTPMMFQ